MLIMVAKAKVKPQERIPSGQRRLGRRLAGPGEVGRSLGWSRAEGPAKGWKPGGGGRRQRSQRDTGTMSQAGPEARPAGT